MNKLLFGLGIYYTLLGIYLLFAPAHFYAVTPGVSMMGPYNSHFIRDVSFAFLASGIALQLGTIQHNKLAVVIGALWPLLHALFHITIWVRRDFVVDRVSVSDFLAVIIPGLLVMLLAIRFNEVRNA
ncbi:hypothetical protein [Arenicella xantha]|nr:hypothetical protein [Arenicella xantha]